MGGWAFDKEKWDASVARHNKYDMKEIFKQFDADGDGKLDIYEISRAFRAIGMPKRDGTKMEMDHATFKSFDTNGDGVISMEELDKGLKPKTRRKIEVLLEAGWAFDKEKWDASVACPSATARRWRWTRRCSTPSTATAMASSRWSSSRRTSSPRRARRSR